MVQRRTRGAERCSAPNSTSEVQTPELAACQSAPAQAARLAWTRRLRHLSPLPWPIPRCLRERAPARCAWRRAHRGRGVPRPLRRPRGTRRCCLRASDAIQLSTRCSRRTSPWLHENCGQEQKQKRKFGQKGRLNVRSTAQKKKRRL